MPHPTSAPATIARALDFHRAGDVVRAEALYRDVLRTEPRHADALRLLGVALLAQGKAEDALGHVTKSAQIDPRSAFVHSDRGLVLHALGRLNEALTSHAKAISLSPDNADAHYNRGNVLLDLDRLPEALRSYEAALRALPSHIPALNNTGLVLNRLGRPREALHALERAISLAPDSPLAHVNRGNALLHLGRGPDAIRSFDKALSLTPDIAEALSGRGNAHMMLRDHAAAAVDLERAVALNRGLDFALGHLLHAKLRVADWRGVAELRATVVAAIRAGRRACVPIEFVAVAESAPDQLACAKIYANTLGAPQFRGRRRSASAAPDGRIRVGYLSANFHDRAPLLHDRAKFEVSAFASLADDHALPHARAKAAYDRYHDISAMTDGEVAALIDETKIDILVDLDGFTGNSRSTVLAARPAPIQVSRPGFPATMGTSWIDYILADHIVIPADHRPFFSENIVYLPGSHRANHQDRPLAPQDPARASAGLPETGFVFCCFNGPHMIMPEVFAVWMRLLHRVPDGVLWLLVGEMAMETNLRATAAKAGIDPHRIVFAPASKLDARLADLFLDTLPCNAPVSDALRAGLPVLTCLGNTFAGRVSASLLHAAGLPELVAPSLLAYEAHALDLATDRVALAAIRARLAANRTTTALFDTDAGRRVLEAAYTEMWRRHIGGADPASFSLPTT